MSQEQGADVWDDPDIILERPGSTGLPRVDGVIASIANVAHVTDVGSASGIGSGSLEDQVGVYEQAHLELRAVLDDPDAAATDAGPA
ncbi:MAG: hypothetical protein WB471_05115 [Nocardioides sp.]